MSRRDRLRAQREATIRDRSRHPRLSAARTIRRRTARSRPGARSSDIGDAPPARLPGGDVRVRGPGQDPRSRLPPGDRTRLDRRPARQLRPGLTDRAARPTFRPAVPRGDRASHRCRRDRRRTRRAERPAIPPCRRRWIGLVRPLLADCVVGDQAVLLRTGPAVRARMADPGPRRHRRSLHHRGVVGPGVRRRRARRARLTGTPSRAEGGVPRPGRCGVGGPGRHGRRVRPRAPAVGRRRHDIAGRERHRGRSRQTRPRTRHSRRPPTSLPQARRERRSPRARSRHRRRRRGRSSPTSASSPRVGQSHSTTPTPATPASSSGCATASSWRTTLSAPTRDAPSATTAASGYLICPCHGAAFDPAHAAAVIAGPADQPLASLPIHVDTASGRITLTG